MAELSVNSVEYYYATMDDVPGQAAALLTILSEQGIDLQAFSVVPMGPSQTQLMIFPSEPSKLVAMAKRASLALVGPQYALLVQGDNELGALVDLHEKLAHANVNIYASTGVADLHGGFGYVIFVRPEDFKKAATVAGAPHARSWHPRPVKSTPGPTTPPTED
jgi:hypothetical protein